MLAEIGTALYDQPVRMPSQFAFLGRAVSMLAGLCAIISPEFNLLSAAAPFARQFMRRSPVSGVLALLGAESVDQLGRDLVREGIGLARTMSALPRKLEHVLGARRARRAAPRDRERQPQPRAEDARRTPRGDRHAEPARADLGAAGHARRIRDHGDDEEARDE